MSMDPLVEKFVVIGVDASSDSSLTLGKVLDDEVHPTFLDIFPFELQEAPSYLDNFKLWGFPEGFSIYNEHCMKINGTRKLQQNPSSASSATTNSPQTPHSLSSIQSKNALHHFILSNQTTEKKYCSTLLIHEEVYVSSDDSMLHSGKSRVYPSQMALSRSTKNLHPQQQQQNPQNLSSTSNYATSPSAASGTLPTNNMIKLYIPKLICVISSSPVLEFQKQFLAFLYKFTIATKLTKQPARLRVFEGLYDRFSSLCDMHSTFAAAEKHWDDSEYSRVLKTLQAEAASTITTSTTNSTQTSNNNNNNIKPTNMTFKLKEEYLINFAVSMLFRIHSYVPQIHSEISQPCPFFEVVFNLSNEEVCRIRPISANPGAALESFFSLHNFSFRPLFERISTRSLIALITAILLERQIVLISSTPNDIICICEAIFTLLYPLKWQCIYIPLLPLALSDILSALMPYIIGLSKSAYTTLQHSIDFSEKVIIDLDTDSETTNHIFSIPESLSVFLSTNIKRLNKKLQESTSQKEQNRNNNTSNNNTQKLSNDTWCSIMLELKTVFLNFMVCLLNNFTPFLLYSDHIDPNNATASKVFAAKEYLAIFDSIEIPFMKEFTSQTMMFSKFIEEAYAYLFYIDFKQQDFVPVVSTSAANNSSNSTQQSKPSSTTSSDLFVFLLQSKKMQKSNCRKEKKFESILNPLVYSTVNIEIEQYQKTIMQQAQIAQQQPQYAVVDITSHLIKYLRFIKSTPLPPQPSHPQNSPMHLSHSKTLFHKLHKPWLMAIPPPQSNVLSKESSVIESQLQLFQPKNTTTRNTPMISSIHHQSKTSRDSRSPFTQTEIRPNIRSVAATAVTSYAVGDDSAQKLKPVNQFHKMNLEYDTWENRRFQMEFDKIQIKFPVNQSAQPQQPVRNVSANSQPRNPLEMYFLQEALVKLIEQQPPSSKTTTNKSNSSFNYTSNPRTQDAQQQQQQPANQNPSSQQQQYMSSTRRIFQPNESNGFPQHAYTQRPMTQLSERVQAQSSQHVRSSNNMNNVSLQLPQYFQSQFEYGALSNNLARTKTSQNNNSCNDLSRPLPSANISKMGFLATTTRSRQPFQVCDQSINQSKFPQVQQQLEQKSCAFKESFNNNNNTSKSPNATNNESNQMMMGTRSDRNPPKKPTPELNNQENYDQQSSLTQRYFKTSRNNVKRNNIFSPNLIEQRHVQQPEAAANTSIIASENPALLPNVSSTKNLYYVTSTNNLNHQRNVQNNLINNFVHRDFANPKNAIKQIPISSQELTLKINSFAAGASAAAATTDQGNQVKKSPSFYKPIFL